MKQVKERVIDLDKRQLKLLKEILHRHVPDKIVWAYGSRVRWKAQDASDLDLVIFDCSTTEKVNLMEAFEESDLLVSVSVMAWEDIPEKFKKKIREKYVVVQEKMEVEGWREVKLEDVAKLNYGKSLPKEKRIIGSVPVYSSAGLIGWNNKALVNSKGLIIGRKGTIGSVYKSEKAFYPIDTTFYIPEDSIKCDLNYLFYKLSNANLERLNSDSAVPGLNIHTAHSQILFVPPLAEQRVIAEILSCLDEKMDILRRQNETLQELAQTLFRKWFIEEADRKWEKKSLDGIAHYLNGLACQKYPPQNQTDKLPVLKIKELNDGVTRNSDWVTSKVDKKYIINLGDIVFSWSGSLMIKVWNGQKCVLNQHLFKITSEKYPKWFYYFWTKHYLEKFKQIAASKATTMGHIKRDDIENSAVLIPTDNELMEMDKKIAPLLDKMIWNIREVNTLRNLSEVLLPKLMSGEVRVKGPFHP